LVVCAEELFLSRAWQQAILWDSVDQAVLPGELQALAMQGRTDKRIYDGN
jgi:hypothetical protein